MKTNYSIEEILSAVDEIHNSKKKKIKEQSFNQSTKKTNISINLIFRFFSLFNKS